MRNPLTPFERAMTLAAVCGSKIALGPAMLATSRRKPNASTWVAAALGEMLLDKLGVFPPRYRPALLIPHALAGAWVAGESMRAEGEGDPLAAPAGFAVAAGVACLAPALRIALSRGLGIPDAILGLAEDYVVLQLGARALGLSMEEMAGVARESAGEIEHRIRTAVPAASVGV